jgi:guanylate kinase
MKKWSSDRIGFPLVLSGPSGVGKTSLVDLLLSRASRCVRSISATTRAIRPGEVEGKSYYFVDEERFLQLREQGDLAESARYNQDWYGTPRDALDRRLEAGYCVVLNIEVQGGLQLRRVYPEAVLVFVLPPSWEELRRRLQGRRTDSKEVIRARIRRAHEEMEELVRYDYAIVNDDLERCASELEAIVRAERRRTSRLRPPDEGVR